MTAAENSFEGAHTSSVLRGILMSPLREGFQVAINGKFRPRFVRGGLLLLFLLTRVSYGGTSSGQIRSVAISPDGKFIAVDFGRESSSFIYRIDMETGEATRLTN